MSFGFGHRWPSPGAPAAAPGVFATWDPDNTSAGHALSGGNLTVTSLDSSWKSTKGLFPRTTGTASFEITSENWVATRNVIVGVGNATMSNATWCGATGNGYGCLLDQVRSANGGSINAWGAGNPVVDGSIVTAYFNFDTRVFGIMVDGVDLGSTKDFSGVSGAVYPMLSLFNIGLAVTANFGGTLTYPKVGYVQGWAEE